MKKGKTEILLALLLLILFILMFIPGVFNPRCWGL
jgi:hypothetical protein